MKQKKDVIIGLGEIGMPLLKILSETILIEPYDINSNILKNRAKPNLAKIDVEFLHICIPHSKNFYTSVLYYEKKYKPKAIVIHSTVSPNTCEKLQKKLKIPLIYSATRGVHKRMLKDLRRYTKFFSVYDWAPNPKWATTTFIKKMKQAGIKTKKMTSPLTLELAKIVVDTSYYGWLINYAQISKLIADEYRINYDEMWSFSDEIHKFLRNRPKMYPGFIGGHCVIPNLKLINNEILNQINKINKYFSSKQNFVNN